MSSFRKPPKAYLGDGAYADFDGMHVVLTTEDGRSETNRVCLEGSVLVAFEDYVRTLRAAIKAHDEGLDGAEAQ